MREIPLFGRHSKGLVALVSDEDYDALSIYRWCVQMDMSQATPLPYARTTYQGKFKYRMHRLVCGAKPGQTVDHINGNTLDNRRENLRIATVQQQAWNRGKARQWKGRRTFDAPKGVTYERGNSTRPWRAAITVSGRKILLGFFATKEEAGAAYEVAAAKYHGEFARTTAA